MKVKFLEVDEESQRLVFSNRRASSQTQMAGHKVGHRTVALSFLDCGFVRRNLRLFEVGNTLDA